MGDSTATTGGDELELADALASHYSPLLTYMRRRVPGLEVAEDLAQDVLTLALGRLAEVDADRPLWPWLEVIARHRLIDHYRRSETANRASGNALVWQVVAPADEGHDPSEALTSSSVVESVLRPLSQDQRVVVRLHDVADWSPDQIADALGRRRDAVYQLLRRGRVRARAEYQRLAEQGMLGLTPWTTLAWFRQRTRRWADLLPSLPTPAAAVAVAALGIALAGASVVSGASPDSVADVASEVSPRANATPPAGDRQHMGGLPVALTPDDDPPADVNGFNRSDSHQTGSRLPVRVGVSVGSSQRSDRGMSLQDHLAMEIVDGRGAGTRGELDVGCGSDAAACDVIDHSNQPADPSGSARELSHSGLPDLGAELAEVDLATEDNCALVDALVHLRALPECEP